MIQIKAKKNKISLIHNKKSQSKTSLNNKKIRNSKMQEVNSEAASKITKGKLLVQFQKLNQINRKMKQFSRLLQMIRMN